MEDEVYKHYGEIEPKYPPDPKKREGDRQKSKIEKAKKGCFLAPWEEREGYF